MDKFPNWSDYTLRQKIAFVMLFAGVVLMLVTVSKIENEIILDPIEIGAMLAGSLILTIGSFPMSGELELRELFGFKAKKNRR